MTPPSARRVALVALRRWRHGQEMADTVFNTVASGASLSSSDRAFALELFAGVLRNRTLLDFWTGRLRQGRIDSDLVDILRLGLYQLLIAETAGHAAVFESVELAPKRHRGLINGILRTADRKRSELRADADAQPSAVRLSHPEFLVERWEKNFGVGPTEKLCVWNNEPPPLYGRINRLIISEPEFLRAHETAGAVPGINGFVRFGDFPAAALARGECYIQDPSTRLAGELLDPKPGEMVLDACAAPGGKTNHLADLMENRGRIVASDRQPDRLRILEENINRLRATVVEITPHDWSKPGAPAGLASASFDRILIDVPCSNTGVMRRRMDLRWRLRPDEFAHMATQQLAIARGVLPFLKPGGVLVYSTCSLEPEENEEVLGRLQEEARGLVLEEQRNCLPFREGFDGAFVARFQKTAD